MRRITILLAGLIAVVALLVVGCGEDEMTDQPEQEEEQLQPVVARQQSAGEQSQRAQQSDQGDSVGAVDEQEEQQQPAQQPSDQAEVEQVQQDESETGQAAEGQAQQAQQEQAVGDDDRVVLGGDRPATLLMPTGADRSEPRPLIVLLHGYGSRSSEADAYFQFSQWVDQRGFGLLLPNGTIDQFTVRHWNATDECCDIFGAEIDDVSYIKSLIDEARTHAEFDHVFAVGHSNGGFMAYRLACEDVPGLRAIVSLAGGAHSDAADCRVPKPLSVLQIHGTEDTSVLYQGGQLPMHPDADRQPVPGAKESVLRWAERADCEIEAVQKLAPINTDTAVAGDETTIWRISQGCAEGVVVELWTIEGGGHVPLVWDTQFTTGILDWLASVYSGELAAGDVSGTGIEERTIGEERTAQLMLPADRGDSPIPLVVSLHGYQGEAEAHDWYFGLSERIPEYNFALITPQGIADTRGYNFWNATDACCNFYGSDVDDYGWLSGLVAEAQEKVDVSGVYVVGYSNGGFMAYRLACDGLDGLVAIVSLAGSSFGDLDRCADATPVSVLQIHGTDDLNIPYAGTLVGEYDSQGGYPGAVALTQRWGERASCDVNLIAVLPDIDLELTIDGAETSVQRIRQGCADGVTIELWTIYGGDHFPLFQDDWPDHLLNWLFNESRTN